MTTLLLIGIVLFGIAPILLAFHRKVKHKKLLVFAIILLNFQSLSTIILPALFTPDLFGGAMFSYLILALMYYILMFLFYWLLISFVPTKLQINIRVLSNPSKIAVVIFLSALFFFSILVVHSNGIFLTNPRLGYQAYREGFGVIWVLYILCVSILFYFIAIKREINVKKILFFTVLMFFTGSKTLILSVFIKSYLVYIWINKKITKVQMIFGILFLIVLMLKLFDQFGASQDFLTRVAAYFDFMNQASKVFEDYDAGQLKHTYGSISLSSFWSYVPRAIYPDKPFAYGSVTLVEMYYPGMAATGHTPSFGMFTTEFVDFGWFAPLFAIMLNLNLILQVFSLVIVTTNANVANRWKVGAILFVFSPGFGFHFPILFTFVVAFILIPALFKNRITNIGGRPE